MDLNESHTNYMDYYACIIIVNNYKIKIIISKNQIISLQII